MYFENEDLLDEELNEKCCGNEEIDVTESGIIAESDNNGYLDLEQPQPGASKTQSEYFFDAEKKFLKR